MQNKQFEDWDKTKNEEQSIQKEALSMCQRNNEIFKIVMVDKFSKTYTPRNLIKEEFDNGQYINITDNQIQSKDCIVTFHGGGIGSHRDFAGLQFQVNQKVPVRWINVVFPGYDGEDERRGNYKGTANQIIEMLEKVFQRRKVQKIIVCGHSFGSYFSLHYMQRKPQRIRGFINLGGAIYYWYPGTALVHLISVTLPGLQNTYEDELYEKLKKDEDREIFFQNYRLNEKKYFPKSTQLPTLTLKHGISYAKLYASVGRYKRIRDLNKRNTTLRLNCFGKTDPYFENKLIYEYLTSNSQKYKDKNEKLLKNQKFKAEIEDIILKKYGQKIDSQNLQSYLCFLFDKTGHSINKRRLNEVSQSIQLYLLVLPVVQKYQSLLQSKL